MLQNCMAQPLRNPFTTDLLDFQPYQIRPCAMHTVNLGVLQSHSGSVMELLLNRNFFGAPDNLADALQNCTTRFKQYAATHRITHSVFLNPGIMGNISGYPNLALKAWNGRVFLSFLAVCLRAVVASSNPPDLEISLAEQATRSLLAWFQIQEKSPRRSMNPEDARSFLEITDVFLRLTSGLARLAMRKCVLHWKILPKHHVPKPHCMLI